MKEFKDRVAVITGGANGIGRGLALKCCKEGMKVVVADIDAEMLKKTENDLRKSSGTLLAVKADVSKYNDIENLKEKTLDAFGGVHLLFNNAGVTATNYLWEHTLEDWAWIMGVNLWGVIHGIKAFVPIMIKQDVECHIVNTSSLGGLIQGHGIYGITKHAIVALSESLGMELEMSNRKINVSVLCPSFVNTDILDSERHRPPDLLNDSDKVKNHPELLNKGFAKMELESGRTPQEVAEMVFQSIIDERFYILTDTNLRTAVRERMENILKAFYDFKEI
ncbi:MAG: SDR family NAD(P)-dependent oxidoreductase [Candidatus Lokiarchaeota archaeon]|nr:SDR family NAD(P)-dependent oxidoreductase [Candidatus Lokiarchaeota archaeon]